jgi:acyl carrier protein
MDSSQTQEPQHAPGRAFEHKRPGRPNFSSSDQSVSAAAIAPLTTTFTASGGWPRLAGSPGTQQISLPAVPTRNVSPAAPGDMSTRNSVVTLEAVTQQIIDLVEKDLDAVDLTADSSLQSQGLDSLKVISLVFKIEEHYDIVLDGEDADDLRTVGDLANLVIRRIEQQS